MRGIFIVLSSILALAFLPSPDFRAEQKKCARVQTAYAEKEADLRKQLKEKGVDLGALHIFIRVFKKEARLEVWLSKKNEDSFSLFKTYDICSSSGTAGPKREGGDGQVPEGFYHVSRFNPYSNFYLSLGISYPNSSDRILGSKTNLGGDIFIHGNCVTIGCMPITDDKIKEVYLLAVEAKNAGQEKIPVHIFPCRMDEEGMKYLQNGFGADKSLQEFWKNIKDGHDLFEKKHSIPLISVKNDGSYACSEK